MSDSYEQTDIYGNGGGGGGGGDISNPIITDGYAIETLKLAACEQGLQIQNATNNGSIIGSLALVSISFKCRSLLCYPTQLGGSGGALRLFIADPETRQILAYTNDFTVSQTGQFYKKISHVWNGVAFIASQEITLNAGKNYYFGLFCSNHVSSMLFQGVTKSNNGVYPWLGFCADNLNNTFPSSTIPQGFEIDKRYYIAATTEAIDS